jgi:hypothetical protein
MRVLVIAVTAELIERLRAECERHLAARWTDELEVDANDVLAVLSALAAEKERAETLAADREMFVRHRNQYAAKAEAAEAREAALRADAALAGEGMPDPMHPSLPGWMQNRLVAVQVLLGHMAGDDDPGNFESAREALARTAGEQP